jgi:hypothetical protein
MRQLHTCAAFPDRTETKLYLSIMDHRHALTKRAGHDPGPTVAVLDFLATYGPWCGRWRRGRGARLVRSLLDGLRAGLQWGWQRLRAAGPA